MKIFIHYNSRNVVNIYKVI